MIYTVTFNPSLDYIVGVKDFIPGRVNRIEHEEICPGGKGINVSVMLHRLGVENIALGFTAGFTGAEIRRRLAAVGCRADFIQVDGLSRINVKLRAGAETELNGRGPDIPAFALDRLYQQLDRLAGDDLLVLAGSIPNSLPADIYETILHRLEPKGIRTVVDATGALLSNVLQYRPFLIKPNHHELGELFGVELSSKAEAAQYARKLQAQGARNVLVSMAKDGAVLLTEDGDVREAAAPSGRVKGSVGAGDSMVAGFLAGYFRTKDYAEAFRLGLAAGSATAFADWLASADEVEAVLRSL